jgi:hypothetical protein
MGGNATGPQYEGADRDSNMQAYDQLPRYLRQTLANADHNYAAREILRDLHSRKLPRGLQAVQAIIDADRHLHNTFAAQGLIPGGQR